MHHVYIYIYIYIYIFIYIFLFVYIKTQTSVVSSAAVSFSFSFFFFVAACVWNQMHYQHERKLLPANAVITGWRKQNHKTNNQNVIWFEFNAAAAQLHKRFKNMNTTLPNADLVIDRQHLNSEIRKCFKVLWGYTVVCNLPIESDWYAHKDEFHNMHTWQGKIH